MTPDVVQRVTDFLRAEIAIDVPISREDDLIASGVLDSAGVMTLVAFLEQEFRIFIDDYVDLVPENFCTIDAIVAFVSRKTHRA